MSEIHLKMIEGEFEREPQDTHSKPSALVLDEAGNPKPKMLRVMTADQVKERVDLQVANTAQAIRTRVLKDMWVQQPTIITPSPRPFPAIDGSSHA